MQQGRADILYTIGHSNHSIGRFIELLKRHQIGAVADVRSAPYSRYCPQFDKEGLAAALQRDGVSYVFLGRQLGARPRDATCYENGRVSLPKVAESEPFKRGLERLGQAMEHYRIALMCAEKDPLDCHRMIFICRILRERGIAMAHILADGGAEDHEHAQRRLVAKLGIEPNLFEQEITEADRIDRAYDQQAEIIACREEGQVEKDRASGSGRCPEVL